MPRRTSWRELVFGLIVLAVITGAALVVIIFARVGTLHGKTFRLFALTGEARGIIRSSEVWLGGQRVGVVKDLRFLPPSAADSNRLLIVMDVLTSASREIRLNSTAQVRSGGTLLGAPVVYLSIGTTATRGVRPGDTVRALPQPDLETVTSEFAIASRQFPEIINNVKLLDQQLHGVEGSLGAFAIEGGDAPLTRLQARAARVAARFSEPGGAVGLALSDHASLLHRARRAMARADSVRALVTGARNSYGRFRRDTTLFREVDDIRNELDIVRARLASPSGALGRARVDSALLQAVAKTRSEMTLIIADMRRRPLRYVHF
ncbi:MAG TPA: MlaD family protein [Gemmatimonadaceae bacterium]|jgi:phospholipid/cholesterol/gamma-HCH transport system substrate-binding protein